MDLKGMIADHMGHFSVYDIPNVLFVLVAAMVFGYLAARWGCRAAAPEARGLAAWASVAALAAALVRSQLPLAALVLAAAVLVGKRERKDAELPLITMLLIGIGCGSGASVVVAAALIIHIPIMRWALGGVKQA